MTTKLPLTTEQPRAAAETEVTPAALAATLARSVDELVHELRVHQVELEMQNEALRQAQVALEESRDKYVDIYDFAPVGYFTLDHLGMIAECNLTGVAMLGKARKDMLHSRFAGFVAFEDRDAWEQFFLRIFRETEKQACELRLEHGDGTFFDAHLDCLPVAAGGAASALRIALFDISRRTRATAELRMSEERLRLAKMAADVGVFDIDLARGNIVWDERKRELWGFGPDEPITYGMFMAGVHPDDRASLQADIDRALDPHGKGMYESEFRIVSRAGGGVRHVIASARAFFEGGSAVRLVGVVKDMTAQKQLEDELQERRSEMDLLVNQQVAAHTANAIAHELNQPLVAISAYSEAALRMLRGGTKSQEKLTRALEGAVEQAQRAGRTLHELLAFLHKSEIKLEQVDLNDIVREALALTTESGYGGFLTEVELENGLQPVLANALQIKKVLRNLLFNGVEAMRETNVEPAAITIVVRTQTIEGVNMAQVTVQDSGPGLDAAAVHRIFDPFFTTKPKGMGLGLAISRALVEAHGGQLWADLEAGPGATFHFTLPFAS